MGDFDNDLRTYERGRLAGIAEGRKLERERIVRLAGEWIAVYRESAADMEKAEAFEGFVDAIHLEPAPSKEGG